MLVSAPDFAAQTEQIRANEERGASLSAELDRREQELVITNLGPDTAMLYRVLLPNDPKEVFLDLQGLEGGQGIGLFAGEKHSITAFAPGLELPVTVEMNWHDSCGEQRRVQSIMDTSEHHRDAGAGAGSASVTTDSLPHLPLAEAECERDGQ